MTFNWSIYFIWILIPVRVVETPTMSLFPPLSLVCTPAAGRIHLSPHCPKPRAQEKKTFLQGFTLLAAFAFHLHLLGRVFPLCPLFIGVRGSGAGALILQELWSFTLHSSWVVWKPNMRKILESTRRIRCSSPGSSRAEEFRWLWPGCDNRPVCVPACMCIHVRVCESLRVCTGQYIRLCGRPPPPSAGCWTS